MLSVIIPAYNEQENIEKTEEYLHIDNEYISILPKYFAVQNTIICSVLQV